MSAQSLAESPAVLNAVIDLSGTLGAGKTTFARCLLRSLGVMGTIKSPTYGILETYHLGSLGCTERSAAHFDFYRFRDQQEWEDAGFREVFAAPGLKLCEWTEKVESLMPLPDLTLNIELQLNSEQRIVVLMAHTQVGKELLASLIAGDLHDGFHDE